MSGGSPSHIDNHNSNHHHRNRGDSHGSMNAGINGGQGVASSTPPLFERMAREDSMNIGAQMKDFIKIIETQNNRLIELDSVNEDLEKRLEFQAKNKMNLESQLASQERLWNERFAALSGERDSWKDLLEKECRKTDHFKEQLFRKDKELRKIFQQKYGGGAGGGGGPVEGGGGIKSVEQMRKDKQNAANNNNR